MKSIVFTTIFCILLVWTVISKSDVTTVEATENAQAGGKFSLITYAWGNSWGSTKYSPTTGEAFYATNGVWVKHAESAPIPVGQYEIQVAVSPTNYLNTLRLEKVSGRTWYLVNNRWAEIKHQ